METMTKLININLNKTAEQLRLMILDVKGSYQLPYIQSAKNVQFKLLGLQSATHRISIELIACEKICKIFAKYDELIFENLPVADYEVVIDELDENNQSLKRHHYESLGIGQVIAALGDSLTEGYHSQGFFRENLQLGADNFPSNTVSSDRRNFPQYAPTTHIHNPQINCFTSWMTELNNLLSHEWGQPLFIANEGWGGISSAGYLKMIETDSNWQTRINKLSPNYWLIHLGVNDERAKVAADNFFRNMVAIVEILMDKYHAVPEKIFIAKPSYDYATGAVAILHTSAILPKN